MIVEGDTFEILPLMAARGEFFHSIVTDPPYGLGSWDWVSNERELGEWHQEWARLALDVVPPGAHMLVFSGTRHFHHMMLAVEHAGWELRDTLLWLKAGGMPKSRNRDGKGTGLKPAWEPIAMFRSPLDGTIFATDDKHRTGMLNIDATRILTQDKLGGGDVTERVRVKTNEHFQRPWMEDEARIAAHAGQVRANVEHAERVGRWPGNVVLDEEAAVALDEQSGDRKAGGAVKGENLQSRPGKHVYGDYGLERSHESYADTGGASRFFYCAKASPGERDAGLPEGMKNKHPTVKPITLCRWLVRLVTCPGGRVLDPFTGSGSVGCAAVAEGFEHVGIDSDPEVVQVASLREQHWADD